MGMSMVVIVVRRDWGGRLTGSVEEVFVGGVDESDDAGCAGTTWA